MRILLDPESTIYRDLPVHITGITGFKGTWLAHILSVLGAKVTGSALPLHERENRLWISSKYSSTIRVYEGDLTEDSFITDIFSKEKPKVLFHLAAQPIVSQAFLEPKNTFYNNFVSTLNLLDFFSHQSDLKCLLITTTDKVYSRPKSKTALSEKSKLWGRDPYSGSKVCVEELISCYEVNYKRNGVKLAALRSGNVIGGGDFAQDRLVPDIIRAWRGHSNLEVRMPNAVRPWQHVLLPLFGYLELANYLYTTPKYIDVMNFGPNVRVTKSVRDLIEQAKKDLETLRFTFHSNKIFEETDFLCLDSALAAKTLGYREIWNFEESVSATLNWYQRFFRGEEATDLIHSDIKLFTGWPNSMFARLEI